MLRLKEEATDLTQKRSFLDHCPRQMDISTVVRSLLAKKSEGIYWDFKRCHHAENEKLLHDILCLANVRRVGQRFLIFGVCDDDFSLCDIGNCGNRKTQADIAGLFRDNAHKFAESRYPQFVLEEVIISNVALDVLVIDDLPQKPYYLIQRYGSLLPYHVYTRVADTNTSAMQSAAPYEIELMYKERFGLDQSPLERMQQYLADVDSWVTIPGDTNLACYYKLFPEFTLRIATWPGMDRPFDEEWLRGEIKADNNSASLYELYYHQTRLRQIGYASFDDHKKSMVIPKWEPIGAGRLYYYEAGSIEYAMQCWHVNRSPRKIDHSLRLEGCLASVNVGADIKLLNECHKRWGHYIHIPVIQAIELQKFKEIYEPKVWDGRRSTCDSKEQYDLFIKCLLAYDAWHTQCKVEDDDKDQ